jgi:hypothetical protein
MIGSNHEQDIQCYLLLVLKVLKAVNPMMDHGGQAVGSGRQLRLSYWRKP